MKGSLHLLCVALVAFAGVRKPGLEVTSRADSETLVRVQEVNTRSVADRVYSSEQADRGRTLFRDVCIICHPDPLWRSSWEGRNVGEIYTKIMKFMPDDAPGSLSPAEAASAIAYILQSNGFPSGAVALPTDATALDRIRIEAPPK